MILDVIDNRFLSPTGKSASKSQAPVAATQN
jgi:hypothetical protein